MSIITTEKDYSTNNPLDAGYFRIGFVTLQIPPQDIVTSRVVNNEKITPLRGMNEMFQKTGQARWDVTVSWTALLNDADTVTRYQQWEDLRNVVAIFKAAPFVEVESPHLRQMLAAHDPEFSTKRLSMGLRQLRVDNHPDVIDALKVTLTMTYFNCLPYTQDFGYQGDSGQGVSAYQSQKFKKYISQWRQINMERAFRYPGDPICPLWLTQNPGELALKWRTYLPIQSGQLPDYAGQLNAPATIGGTVVPPNITPKKPRGKISLPPAIMQLIQQIAPQFNVDPSIMEAVCWHESGGNPNAKNPNSTAKGLFQLLDGTAKTLGVTNSYDPTQNTTGACKYMSSLKNQFGSYELALAAYAVGPAYVKCYLNGTTMTLRNGTVINLGKQVTGGIPPTGMPAGADAPGYVSAVMGAAQSAFGYNGTATSTTQAAQPASAPATNASTPASSGSNPTTTTTSSTEAAFEGQVTSLVSQGWSVDHRADPGGVGILFLYKENELRVAPQDSDSGGVQQGLWPEGLSVLFVNNLAQIPLAGFQYPTYQHVGPCSSLVQVSFGSQGTRENPNTDEPIHNGLMTLTSMAHMLEQQYQRLRTQFRSIASVHRMHAVYVENQVLNMLGIFGLMLDQVTTETVPDSSDMAMAQLTGCQYENKFEELTSYKVNAIDGVYMTALQQTVLQGDTLAQAATAASPDERALLGAAFTYRQDMASSNETDMCARLLNAAENPSDSSPFGFMNGAQSFFVSETDANALTNEFMGKASSYPVAAARVKQLQQSGNKTQWTMADYLMFKSCAYDAAGTSAIYSLVSSIDQGLTADTDLNRQSMVSDVYVRLFPYFAENDPSLRNALNQIMQSPTLGAGIKHSVSASDPALLNTDHGAYRDMGLNSQVLDGEDFNPGMYFTSDKTSYLAKTKAALGNIAAQIASGSSQLNSDSNGYQIPAGTIPLSVTTSIPGNMDSIMKMINVPGYSMTEAFPTFKLFFMEDANSGIYYAFDNFYSYSAVIDIEVQRPTNKPATLRMKLMNLTHLLSHKLYDASLAGKWEASLDRFAINTGGTAAATGSDVPTKGFVGRTGIGGAPYQVMGKDNTEGYTGGDMANRRIPLQYFPLQTGSKIQLRVGFSNNPDKLIPVFCGEVTEIEGNEILTVTAQSFLLELATLSGDKMNSNSWFQLGSLLQNTVNVLIPGSGGGMSKGPAYGGITIFGDSGDVGTVIWMMLKNSGAKHFGHWQVNSPANSLLKGFSWKELAAAPAGAAAGAAGMDNVATALQNVYDRCDENIMVDTAVQYDGTSVSTDPKTHSQSRTWMDSRKYPWAPASYYVDSKTTMTVWDLIQDISRRYPEYLLLEKWYGFPYSCDATLVYGHPFDWYTARPRMLGDTERVRALNQNNSAYTQWWNASGKQMFLDVMSDSTMPVTVGLYKNQLLQQASTSPSGLSAALQSLLTIAVDGFDTGSQTANDWLALPGKLIYTIIPGEREALRNLQKKINAVQSAYYASVLAGDQQSTDFLKPVRRYHFIDHQSIVHTYSDGSTLNVTAQCTWSTNTSCLSVTVGGMVTAVRAPNPQTNGARPLFNTTVSATLNGITGTMALTVVAAATAPATPVLPSYRSHRTQVLLNYFDISDQRVREEPYSIDAQLLNTAAIALDDSQQRIAREIASRTLATCPTGIDNRGLYYMVKLPSDFPLAPGQTLLNQVIGTINSGSTSQNIAVQPYDDRLPVPTGYIADPSQTQVAMANPVLFDVTGTGDDTASIWNPQTFGPFSLPIPNILTFWLEGVQGSQMALNIFVQGEEYPLPVWADQQEGASETITASNEGFFTGIKIWQNISSIIVRGLPAGVRLRCWQMPFNLPAVPDATRPYTHPLFRDVLFDRYWLVSTGENLLKELYMMDNFSTLEYVQSYSMTTPLGAIAVEPNTWGILGASGTSLLYWDRREPLPGQLSAPAMTTEPLYGLNVKYNISQPGPTRYATLLPVPYGSASTMSTWRYLVMTPDGNYQALLPDGTLIAYSGGAGWQEGTLVPPVPVSVALTMIGTYVFVLECMGSGPNPTADEVPYPNLATPAGNTYDLSSIVPAIQGIAYDVMGRLWVWTGTNAVAIKPRYDGYILDPNSLAIYLTDTYDSVSFE